MDNNKQLSPEEMQVNKIVKEASRNITKLEADIKKMDGRGTLQLNYNPPGMPDMDRQQQLKDKEKLENNIKLIKADTIRTTDKLIEAFPLEQQRNIQQGVREQLYPPKEKQELDLLAKREKDFSPGQEYILQKKADFSKDAAQNRVTEKERPTQSVATRFGESLNHSRFLSQQKNELPKEKGQEVNKERKTGKDDR